MQLSCESHRASRASFSLMHVNQSWAVDKQGCVDTPLFNDCLTSLIPLTKGISREGTRKGWSRHIPPYLITLHFVNTCKSQYSVALVGTTRWPHEMVSQPSIHTLLLPSTVPTCLSNSSGSSEDCPSLQHRLTMANTHSAQPGSWQLPAPASESKRQRCTSTFGRGPCHDLFASYGSVPACPLVAFPHRGKIWQPSSPRPPQSRTGIKVSCSSCRDP